eukprot:1068020-Prorocentrum_lima.AAC.1
MPTGSVEAPEVRVWRRAAGNPLTEENLVDQVDQVDQQSKAEQDKAKQSKAKLSKTATLPWLIGNDAVS